MQRIDAVIPEITRQVVYPVAEQISRTVLKRIGVYELFADNLFYVNDDETSSDFRSADDKMRTHENRCDIEIIPNLNPMDDVFNSFRSKDTEVSRVAARSLYQDIPVFADKRDQIGLFEHGVPCSVTLNFKMMLKSRELVDAVHTTIFSKSQSAGAIYEYNQFTYSYGLPDAMLLALYKMFQLKDFGASVVPYPTYLRYGSNDKIGIVRNRDSDAGVVSITKTITDVLGKLDFSGGADSEKQNRATDRYLVAFSYVFEFYRPMALQLEFPIMVNGSMVPKSLLTTNTEIGYVSEIEKNLKDKNINQYYYDRSQLPDTDNYECVRYPAEDAWRLPSAFYSQFKKECMFRCIILLGVDMDTTTRAYSVNLDLNAEVFPMMTSSSSSSILQYWEDHSPLSRSGLYSIKLFAGDNVVDSSRVEYNRVTNTMKLADEYVTKAKIYRFTITQTIHIKALRQIDIYYMLDNYTQFRDVLILSMDYLVKHEYVRIVSDNLGNKELLRSRYAAPLNNGYSIRAMTIGNFVVEALRPAI